MSSALRRSSLLLAALLLALAGAYLAWGRGHSGPAFGQELAARQAALGDCLRERANEMRHEGRGEERDRECAGAPESSDDIARINDSVTSRLGSSDSRGALARGIAQRNRLRATA